MKITVELSDSDIKAICKITGESKKGPAIRKLVVEALQMKQREISAQKFISGTWGVELKGFEKGLQFDQQSELDGKKSWGS